MKTRTKYVAAIAAVLGVIAVAAYGYGFRYHEPHEYVVWRMERIAKELELNETQTAKLNVVKDAMLKTHGAMRAGREQKRQAVLELLEQPTFDRERALGLVQQSTGEISDRASEVIAAVGDFYDSLTPAQQQQVREVVKERMEHFGRYGRHRQPS